MNDEMRVKAVEPEAYQYATGRVFSDRSVGASLLGNSWRHATLYHTVLKFWLSEAYKIECPKCRLLGDGLYGRIRFGCSTAQICPERIAAAEAAWEKEHATEQGVVTNGKVGIVSENMSLVGDDELSRLRKENEELKAAASTPTEVRDNSGNVCTVAYWGSLDKAKAALASNKNCKSCWNCKDCTDCTDCETCKNCVNLRIAEGMIGKRGSATELSQLRKENEELKAALEAARKAIRFASHCIDNDSVKSLWNQFSAVKAALEESKDAHQV